MGQPIIQFKHISKAFDGQLVLRDLSLNIEAGEFVTVIGRSGCGKTTLLRLINRLITPDQGCVMVQGQDVAQTDPIIAYVPSISGMDQWKGKNRRELVEELLAQVGLDPILADRYPRTLSGGQRQRVGIARALAARPEILLMDEPFGAVDEITRGQLQQEIRRIHEDRGITILFVTLDIEEALKLGSRVLVLDHGVIQQYAMPEEILQNPATEFVKQLVGTCK